MIVFLSPCIKVRVNSIGVQGDFCYIMIRIIILLAGPGILQVCSTKLSTLDFRVSSFQTFTN